MTLLIRMLSVTLTGLQPHLKVCDGERQIYQIFRQTDYNLLVIYLSINYFNFILGVYEKYDPKASNETIVQGTHSDLDGYV